MKTLMDSGFANEWVGFRNPMLYPFELRARTSVFISLPALVAPEAVQNLDMPQKLEPTGASHAQLLCCVP